MGRTPTDPATAEALGEIRGQLREMIHNVNNQMQKSDATARIIIKLESVPEDIAEIKQRLTTLETDRHRRDGALGIGAALMRSPLLAWMFAAAVIAWTWFRGGGE